LRWEYVPHTVVQYCWYLRYLEGNLSKFAAADSGCCRDLHLIIDECKHGKRDVILAKQRGAWISTEKQTSTIASVSNRLAESGAHLSCNPVTGHDYVLHHSFTLNFGRLIAHFIASNTHNSLLLYSFGRLTPQESTCVCPFLCPTLNLENRDTRVLPLYEPPGPPRRSNLRTMLGPYSWYCQGVSHVFLSFDAAFFNIPQPWCGNRSGTQVSVPRDCHRTTDRVVASCA
jgi:hypothetical protein